MTDANQKLQKALQKINQLQEENEKLKALLEQHQISYKAQEESTSYQTQTSKADVIKQRIHLFKKLFRGRTDVYPFRWESQNGKAGYSPACHYEWHPEICQKPKIKCSQCTNQNFIPLTDQVIYNHLSGKQTIGIYPLLPDNTCFFLAIDFDKANWQDDVQAFLSICESYNIPAYLERSRSGQGGHVWIFFKEAITASLARKLGSSIITKTLETRYQVGMDSYDRMFPNQDTIPSGGFGNLIALPLQNEPRKQGNSVFLDENFKPYEDQWAFLASIKTINGSDIYNLLDHLNVKNQTETTRITDPSKIKISIKNGIWIEQSSLSPKTMNEIIQLGTLKNPQYYKAKAQRLSTHKIPSIIDCTEEVSNYIVIPRGTKEEMEDICKDKSIQIELKNHTVNSPSIHTNFKGKLTPQQELATNELLKYDTGVLSATTGFGKTVVGASLIAERQTSTLIIVHRKQLLEQWKERLFTFLDLEKDDVGQIGGGKHKPSRKVDIATIQSLTKNGEVKDIIKEYGQVIVDECHHISAWTFERVLKEVEAKYVHGLTATPTRKDGLHPIMTMQCGPIRYKVSTKQQAKVQPFSQYLIPKYTSFKSKQEENNKSIQGIYEELIHDSNRNNMIFDDVLNALEEGRTPLLLTERQEHVRSLFEKFNGFVKNIIVLTGGLKKSEEKERLQKLKDIPENEEILVISTGKYIGEGFDDSRLDTLFLTIPISWKGTLQQYVGRLQRNHVNKQDIRVYDYIDHKEGMLKRMFEKRKKGYNALNYKWFNSKDSSNEQMELF